MSSSLKHELADHIYQYLCHEAQYSDLPESAKESLTAASECIEQAYKLNTDPKQQSSMTSSKAAEGSCQLQHSRSADILPDELLRIFTRHKEFLSQQKDSLIHQLRTIDRDEATSTSNEKPDIRVSSNTFQATNIINDYQTNSSNINSNTTSNTSPTLTNNINAPSSSQITSASNNSQHQQAPVTTTATKHHNQHPISQLPMTTRKKLSHLRAQIKRQASKAARSRLEKRSSVSGAVSTNISGDKSGHFGVSCEVPTKYQGGDSHHHHHHSKDLHNQPNSSSSTESPNTYLGHQSNPSTAAGTTSNSADSNTNTNMSPTLHSESAHGTSGSSNPKLVGQHSLAASSHHNNNHHHHSIHQKNFKQKIIALLKKFRTDGSDFDSEEQYREALERELIKAAAGRGSRAIEELLEEDIDVEEESGSEPEDWDNISESSTPKPSLRPFFSSTTLDKI